MNLIHSNDHVPLETRSFEEVSNDLNCSYMFLYTHEDFVQEARTMLTDMTIEYPTSPARKENRQEEYSECQDEPVIDEACKKLIIEYQNNEKTKDILQSTKPNVRTDEENSKMRELTQISSRLKKIDYK